jgi:hypothetical protein
MSFRLGEGEEVRRGRLFCDYTEERLAGVLVRHPALDTVSVWQTEDQRSDRRQDTWSNAIVCKRQQEKVG